MPDSATVVAEAEVYVVRWQERLGIQNWRVLVTAQDADLDTIATISRQEHYRKALITIDLHEGKNTWEIERQLSGEILEQAVLHELIHLMLDPIRNLLSDELNTGDLWKRFSNAQETVVDELTSVIWRLHGSGD